MCRSSRPRRAQDGFIFRNELFLVDLEPRAPGIPVELLGEEAEELGLAVSELGAAGAEGWFERAFLARYIAFEQIERSTVIPEGQPPTIVPQPLAGNEPNRHPLAAGHSSLDDLSEQNLDRFQREADGYYGVPVPRPGHGQAYSPLQFPASGPRTQPAAGQLSFDPPFEYSDDAPDSPRIIAVTERFHDPAPLPASRPQTPPPLYHVGRSPDPLSRPISDHASTYAHSDDDNNAGPSSISYHYHHDDTHRLAPGLYMLQDTGAQEDGTDPGIGTRAGSGPPRLPYTIVPPRDMENRILQAPANGFMGGSRDFASYPPAPPESVDEFRGRGAQDPRGPPHPVNRLPDFDAHIHNPPATLHYMNSPRYVSTYDRHSPPQSADGSFHLVPYDPPAPPHIPGNSQELSPRPTTEEANVTAHSISARPQVMRRSPSYGEAAWSTHRAWLGVVRATSPVEVDNLAGPSQTPARSHSQTEDEVPPRRTMQQPVRRRPAAVDETVPPAATNDGYQGPYQGTRSRMRRLQPQARTEEEQVEEVLKTEEEEPMAAEDERHGAAAWTAGPSSSRKHARSEDDDEQHGEDEDQAESSGRPKKKKARSQHASKPNEGGKGRGGRGGRGGRKGKRRA
ncbi:hypothetical protein CALCODRAFT_23674 [Calocera cornea HHB12733]|uniref:Uncharacterized protein n=1 Tax=Calocera cornea HHB12733 TaxID=1353952 RepID=A0A165E4R2_9BASI|nr:hypothetical protein CALCODRAFT_23674 [Calocera cornea HHB12733]